MAMGRPAKPKRLQRSERTTVRWRPEEIRQLRSYARARDLEVAEAIRELVLAAIKREPGS